MRIVDSVVHLPAMYEQKTAWVESIDTGLKKSNRERIEWSWKDVRNLTAATVCRLLDLGVNSQDRICNLGKNSLAWAILDLACSALNAIHVPLDVRMGVEHRNQCIQSVMPKWIFLDWGTQADPEWEKSVQILQDLVGNPENGPSEMRPEVALQALCNPFCDRDVANILFTSGTTSSHKGVMLTHRNLVSNANAKLDAMPQRVDDHRLNFLPFSHAYARTCELTTWLLSYGSLETCSGIENVLKIASAVQPTLINGVPLFYERLDRIWSAEGYSNDSLLKTLGPKIRRLASGGAPIGDAVRCRFKDAGLPIFQGYGLTEASPVVCSNRSVRSAGLAGNEVDNLTEVGPPVDGVQVKIDSDSRLWVSGDCVMKGYWNDPVATQQRIVDGWLDTGDIAQYSVADSQIGTSTIRILGRADDTIVLSTGYKIFPLAIEQTLKLEAWIEDCMLVGNRRSFPILLLRPKLDISGKPMADETDRNLLDRIRVVLAPFAAFALPKKWLVCSEDWTAEAGLTNFKGGLRRKKIEEFYSVKIEMAYRESPSLT